MNRKSANEIDNLLEHSTPMLIFISLLDLFICTVINKPWRSSGIQVEYIGNDCFTERTVANTSICHNML